jgi:hypothetical protein
MTTEQLLEIVRQAGSVRFNETIGAIDDCYQYTPTRFLNGLGEYELVNEAGANEGSCRIFYFAKEHGLTVEQTLSLFGEHYEEVKAHPNSTSHLNIRTFLRFGWDGIQFDGKALTTNLE